MTFNDIQRAVNSFRVPRNMEWTLEEADDTLRFVGGKLVAIVCDRGPEIRYYEHELVIRFDGTYEYKHHLASFLGGEFRVYLAEDSYCEEELVEEEIENE